MIITEGLILIAHLAAFGKAKDKNGMFAESLAMQEHGPYGPTVATIIFSGALFLERIAACGISLGC